MTKTSILSGVFLLGTSIFASPIKSNKLDQKLGFTAERIVPTSFQAISEDTISLHSFPLTRREVGSYKHGYFRAIQSNNRHPNGNYKLGHKLHGTAPLTSIDGGLSFNAEITFGNQNFSALLDTGSSDTWLVRNNFVCSDVFTGKKENQTYCNFGPPFNPDESPTFKRIPNMNTNISYADAEYLFGYLGHEDVTLGGIKVRTEIGVVDRAAWFGDGQSSGLIGFSYPDITTAFPGNDSGKDLPGQAIPYNPIFTTMYKQGLVNPVFSLALSRSNETGKGGVLAIGGLPEGINYDRSSMASMPIEILYIAGHPWCTPIGCLKKTQIQEYTITVDSFEVTNKSSSIFFTPFQAIVDSGTSGIYVPEELSNSFHASFDPPAIYNASQGAFVTGCKTKVPKLEITLGGKKFSVRSEDLITEGLDGFCVTNVASGGIPDPVEEISNDGLYILGDAFLKNVLTVFDVGAGEVRMYKTDY